MRKKKLSAHQKRAMKVKKVAKELDLDEEDWEELDQEELADFICKELELEGGEEEPEEGEEEEEVEKVKKKRRRR